MNSRRSNALYLINLPTLRAKCKNRRLLDLKTYSSPGRKASSSKISQRLYRIQGGRSSAAVGMTAPFVIPSAGYLTGAATSSSIPQSKLPSPLGSQTGRSLISRAPRQTCPRLVAGSDRETARRSMQKVMRKSNLNQTWSCLLRHRRADSTDVRPD